jgi:hypothetical protein
MIVRIYLLIFILFMGLLSLSSFMLTRAYFSDSESNSFSFVAAAEFDEENPGTPTMTPTVTPSPTISPTVTSTAGKIVINEIFESSSNSAEWVELYNVGGQSIDISGWTISDNVGADVLPFVVPIQPGEIVIITPNPWTYSLVPQGVKLISISGDANIIGNGLANGGDKVVLRSGNTIIDQVSWGDNNEIFSPSAAKPTSNNSLRRIPNGIDTDAASDWQVGAPSIGGNN